MTDKEQIIRLYKEMYTAMVNKDRAGLERVHDDSTNALLMQVFL